MMPNPTQEPCFQAAMTLYNAADWMAAAEAFQVIVQLQPKHPHAVYQLACIAREQGEWALAADYFEQVIVMSPLSANIHLDLGNAYRHLGQSKQALLCFLQVVKLQPDSWKGHYSLARMYGVTGESLYDVHYEKALALAPDVWVIHYQMAETHFNHSQYQQAARKYELALTVEPSRWQAKIGLGATLMHLNQVDDAKSHFQTVSQSDDVHLLSHLARVIWEYKFFNESIDVLKKMVALRPDLHDTHLNLAVAYVQNWHLSQAVTCLTASLQIKPECQEAEDLLSSIYVKQGQCEKAIALNKAQVEREGDFSKAISSYLFTLLYSAKITVEEKLQQHKKLMLPWVNDTQIKTFSNDKKINKQLRIGYVSADFRDQHPVGIFIEPLLSHYDRDQFEVTAYYNSRTYDESTLALKSKVTIWRDTVDWTDERLCQQIKKDGIDILVDLSGHTAKNRLRLFAKRAAPVQITWMAYPHSTGLSTMDYLIADQIVCPPENDHLCTEQVLRLKEHCVFCYTATDEYGAIDNLQIEQRQQVVFGSFNNLTKVNDVTLDLWVKVLKAVPGSLLKLKTPSFTDRVCLQSILAYFTDRGIDKAKLLFSGPSSLKSMMQEYNEVDIALDPIPYNGGTTSMQAMWMGVPVITLKGYNFCGRMGMSINHYAECDEWVANSVAEYVNIAQQKAQNRAQLVAFKTSLRERMLASPLCDAKGFTADIEACFRLSWQRYCEK
jgi:protein O-GlcNAc transferase